ncbi:hypothetical protein F2Q68_00046697 [Brassica cretica]|uniref:Proteasome subunit alpha type n=1 Tax=Brassica cretica TaxID=69181 RepID=A0A8S9LPM6_BRACR|nr:hypothetical protein F2Q68_00046697 [Brassica cretica]
MNASRTLRKQFHTNDEEKEEEEAMESDHVMMMRTTASFRTRNQKLQLHYFLRLSLPSSLLDPYIKGFFEVSLKVQMGDSQYSFSLTTFSPSGKLVQIEHALTAVGSGQTSLGIKASNGVVIATEKKLPSILVDEASVQKIQNLTPNIGVVYSSCSHHFNANFGICFCEVVWVLISEFLYERVGSRLSSISACTK